MKRACEISLKHGGRVQLRSEHEDAVQLIKQSYEDALAEAHDAEEEEEEEARADTRTGCPRRPPGPR